MKMLLAKSQRDRVTTSPSIYLIGTLTAGAYLLTYLFYIRGPEVRSRTARELFAWFIALFLAAGHWLRRLIVLITCAQLLSITFFKQAYMLNYFAMILIPAWIVLRQARGERALAAPASEDLPAAPISTASPPT